MGGVAGSLYIAAGAMELLATGIKSQQNSLVYFLPPAPSRHVVFFQGDTQVKLPPCINPRQFPVVQTPRTCT